MLKEFIISKSSPKIIVTVTRDSVCAGDDGDAPHDKSITLPSFINTIDFIRQITTLYSLPLISGGKATWTCHLNGKKIAVIAQQWSSPKAIIHELKFNENNELHFQYHEQSSPGNHM